MKHGKRPDTGAINSWFTIAENAPDEIDVLNFRH